MAAFGSATAGAVVTWAVVWRFARTWWGGFVAGGLSLLVAMLAASIIGNRSPAPGSTPYTAEPTKRAAEADKVTETLDVQTLKPKPKDRARIAREYRQPGILAPAPRRGDESYVGDQANPSRNGLADAWSKEIVSEVKFEPAPAGGTALTTVDRATGQVETIVRPRPEPLISFANRWRILGAYGQFEDREPIIRAQLEWWPVKVRRLEFGAAAGWERTDRGRAYVLAQVAVAPR